MKHEKHYKITCIFLLIVIWMVFWITLLNKQYARFNNKYSLLGNPKETIDLNTSEFIKFSNNLKITNEVNGLKNNHFINRNHYGRSLLGFFPDSEYKSSSEYSDSEGYYYASEPLNSFDYYSSEEKVEPVYQQNKKKRTKKKGKRKKRKRFHRHYHTKKTISTTTSTTTPSPTAVHFTKLPFDPLEVYENLKKFNWAQFLRTIAFSKGGTSIRSDASLKSHTFVYQNPKFINILEKQWTYPTKASFTQIPDFKNIYTTINQKYLTSYYKQQHCTSEKNLFETISAMYQNEDLYKHWENLKELFNRRRKPIPTNFPKIVNTSVYSNYKKATIRLWNYQPKAYVIRTHHPSTVKQSKTESFITSTSTASADSVISAKMKYTTDSIPENVRMREKWEAFYQQLKENKNKNNQN
ncbi:uncharacterized protein LOC142330524 isoform X1 [Lycorma delicatula]|uniref:uncharacterized protein LOC142330524 isoform X1 n=1 Tax=Lycorma delicatula TaxID=130591 RepID=UPI003F512889